MLVINPSSTFDMSSSELDDMYSFSFSESGSYSSMYVSNTKDSILYKIDTIYIWTSHIYTKICFIYKHLTLSVSFDIQYRNSESFYSTEPTSAG